MYLKFDLETEFSSPFSGLIKTSKLISKAWFPVCCKYGSGFGSSCFGLSQRKGCRASKVTIQGEMDEAKFFAKNGPRGTYSHFWISRALQSLKSTNPKMYSSASFTGIGSPSALASVVIKAISSSKSTNLEGPKTGSVAPSGIVCPQGLRAFIPLGIIDELLP